MKRQQPFAKEASDVKDACALIDTTYVLTRIPHGGKQHVLSNRKTKIEM